jgi:hypothetical protein
MIAVMLLLLSVLQPQQTTYPVGFRSFWAKDPARTYRTAFDDGKTYGATKSPRPVLVNVWYPARPGGTAMQHRGYLDIKPDDPGLQPLATALEKYQRQVIDGELLGSKELPAEPKSQLLKNFWERSTGCVRDATALQGKFPLVIYHSGAGSSFEDNALLCEELARGGYVVIGSPFMEASGKSFNVDAVNAGREFEFLIRLAAEMPNVDTSKIALIGHSAGAHASLIYGSKPGIAIDAIVSLDTTQDYVTSADPRWHHLTSALHDGVDSYVIPTMFVAGPMAMYELADTLHRSERVYLTMPDLTHNEYIIQGEVTAFLKAEQDKSVASKERASKVIEQGKDLRRLIQFYLAAKLKDDDAAFAELLKLQANKLGHKPTVELMKPGSKQSSTPSDVPNPRTILYTLKKEGVCATIAELERGAASNQWNRNPYFAFQLLYYLSAKGRMDDVKQLHDYFSKHQVKVREVLVAQADMFFTIKRHPAFVEECVRLGEIIGGDHAGVAGLLKKVKATPAKP